MTGWQGRPRKGISLRRKLISQDNLFNGIKEKEEILPFTFCGVLKPDRGEIYFNNQKLDISSPHEAREFGIETVHQDLSLVDTMPIAWNMFLRKEPTIKIGPFKFLNKEKMNQEASKVIGKVGIKVRSPDEFVSILSGGKRQAIAIIRTVYFDA